MRELRDSSQGSIVLEASLVIPIFMLILMCLYGLFVVTSAQNTVTHALVQSSKSLSLDPYLMDHVSSLSNANTFWKGLGSVILGLDRLSNDEYFTALDAWYEGDESSTQAKKRFIGYFANGDEAAADEKLRSLGVEDGLNGVDFDVVISDKDMTITIKYEVQFWFDAFDLGKIPMEQSVTTRLWK